MKKFLFSLGLVFICLTFISSSQSYTVVGRVIDENYQSVSNADVDVVGKTLHVTTNDDGNFAMSGVVIGDTLSISHLGYSTKYVRVEGIPSGQGIISLGVIILEEDD